MVAEWSAAMPELPPHDANTGNSIPNTEPTDSNTTPEQAEATTTPEQREKIEAVARTKKELGDLVRDRQRADSAGQSTPDHLSNQDIRRARSAAMLALVQLYPTGEGYDDARRDKYEDAKNEIWDMAEPYLEAPTPLVFVVPYQETIAGRREQAPEEIEQDKKDKAFYDNSLSLEIDHNNEKSKLFPNKKKLIEITQNLIKLYADYIEIIPKAWIDTINTHTDTLASWERKLAELEKPKVGIGRRASLMASGVIGAVGDAVGVARGASKKVGDEFTKLKQDLAGSPAQKLEILKQRSAEGAKKLLDMGIKTVEAYDRLPPKAKLAIGVGAAGLSILPFGYFATGALRGVSLVALSRKSYTEQMTKAFEDFAYGKFVESKRDFYENTKIPKIKRAYGADYRPASLEYYLELNLEYPEDPKYLAYHKTLTKEKEEFMSGIKMSDFEADPSYKDKRYRAIEISLAKGLTFGVLMPGVIKEFIDSPAFDFIKDKVAELMPGAAKEQVRVAVQAVAASADPVVAAPDATASAAEAGAPSPVAQATDTAPAAQAPSGASAPVAAAPVSPSLSTEYTISVGDNLETLMKDKLDILEGLTPKQQENIIYNFFESSVGKEWMKENNIANMNKIFTGASINLKSLNEAIADVTFTHNGGSESLITRAERLFPSS